MSFNIDNKLIFTDAVQSLRNSLDNLVKNSGKGNFKYLSQEFNRRVLDFTKHKGFYPMST